MEEDRRAKLPKNFESRKKRAEWELENKEKKKVFVDLHDVCFSLIGYRGKRW